MTKNNKESKFIKDLHQLMQEHNVVLKHYDKYDSEESYTGSIFYFKSQKIDLEIDEDLINMLKRYQID